MEKNITKLKDLPLSNDFMFGEVMRQEDICKLFLEELLQTSIERIEYVDKQKELSDSYVSHGIRLDVYVRDSSSVAYTVEMQAAQKPAMEKRARYYQSGIDRYSLEKGVHYSKLPDSYVIFVCAFDYFGRGQAVYRKRSCIEDCPEVEYVDGSHLYFLNSKYSSESTITAVTEFLRLVNNEDFLPTTLLGKRVKQAVEDVRNDASKEEPYMTFAMRLEDERIEYYEKGKEDGVEIGVEIGVERGKLESLSKMMKELAASGMEESMIEGLVKNAGFTTDDIAEAKKLM